MDNIINNENNQMIIDILRHYFSNNLFYFIIVFILTFIEKVSTFYTIQYYNKRNDLVGILCILIFFSILGLNYLKKLITINFKNIITKDLIKFCYSNNNNKSSFAYIAINLPHEIFSIIHTIMSAFVYSILLSFLIVKILNNKFKWSFLIYTFAITILLLIYLPLFGVNYEKMRKCEEDIDFFLDQDIKNIIPIKQNLKIKEEMSYLEKYFKDLGDFYENLVNNFLEYIFMFSIFTLIIYLLILFDNESTITLPLLFQLISLFFNFQILLLEIIPSFKQIENLLNEYKYVKLHFYNGEIIIKKIKNITLKNFSYGKLSADDICIDVSNEDEDGDKKGSITHIVGHSGSGKTQLISLILDLTMQVPDGIFINGIPLKLINRAELRNTFGFVKRDPEIFENRTVFQNLYIKNWNELYKQIEDIQLCNCIKQIISFIMLDGNTLGKQLSGGQRKIVYMLSILLKYDFIFIDEGVGGFDNETSFLIWNLLLEMCNNKDKSKRKKIINIDHHLGIIKSSNCPLNAKDVIFITKDKKIIQGNIDFLLKNNLEVNEMIYANLSENKKTESIK